MTTAAKPLAERVFDRLGDTLQNGVDVHRCVAATALGKLAYPGTTEALQTALLDEDEDVRIDAVAALATLDDPQTASAVMENFLGDPCPDIKLAAIELLASVDHREIVPWLLKLVKDRDEGINWDNSGYYATGWDDWLDIQLAAIRALGQMGVNEAVPVIIEAIEDEEGQDVSQVAIPVLAQLSVEGIEALTSLYSSGDVRMRRRVCAVLRPGQSLEMDRLLASCLSDKADEVRYVAVDLIIENTSDDKRLWDFFDDKSADIRTLIVEKLGAKNPDKIAGILSDKSSKVRQSALRIIADNPGSFEKEGFSEVLRQAIAGVPEVAATAAVAWAALIGKPSAKSLGEALQDAQQPLAFRLGLIEALSLLDGAGFLFLAEAAGDNNRQVRIAALTALAQIAAKTQWPNDAGKTLIAALEGDLVEPVAEDAEAEDAEAEDTQADVNLADDDVPAEADEAEVTSTLGQIINEGIRTEPVPEDGPQPEEIELSEEDEKFIELSKLRAMKKGKMALEVKVGPHQDVRRFAARLLGDFNQPGVPKCLGRALKTDDSELKQSCLESLSRIGAERGKLKKRLFKKIRDEAGNKDRNVRLQATRCLGYIKGKRVDEVLVELSLEDDVHVRLEAIKSLGRKKSHPENLLAALDDEYSGVRVAAAKALAANQTAMDRLINVTLAHDGMHRQEIVAMLKDWNSHEAAEKYLTILDDDTKKRTWQVAIEALGDLFDHSHDEDIQAVA